MVTQTARMVLMKRIAHQMFQLPPAAWRSSSVRMDVASWTSTTVMATMTVGTGLMNLTARLTSHVALGSSCATVACALMLAGGVMETPTAMTSQMRGTALHLCAQLTSSAVNQGAVSVCPGAVMGKMTALTTVMRRTVRIQGRLSVPQTSSSVGTGVVLDRGSCAMEQMIVEMVVMRAHIKTAVHERGRRTVMSTTVAVLRSARWHEGWCSAPAIQVTGSWKMDDHAKM